MTGPEFDASEDDDGPETFRPAPHPDDRLWRHPSEMAAQNAAKANATTAQIPVIDLTAEKIKSRPHVGLMLAAGVVIIGAAALTLGSFSSTGTRNDSPIASIATNSPQEPVEQFSTNENTAVAIEATTAGEERLAARVHNEVATSLPRIQAATSKGMQEGSGFFVTDDGHIATSAGLVATADYILAWTDDGQRWKAHIVAADPVSDVAIIQIDSEDWPAVSLDISTDLRAGQYALALDHDHDEISIGEVTTIGSPLVGVDQPAARPGSAIMDDTGVVIGMITSGGSNQTATPAWMLEQVAVDLISSGTTIHTWLGLIVESHPTETDMVLVREVVAGSPAAESGIQAGDLIDSMNGTPTMDAPGLFRQVQALAPGDDAVLTVTRYESRRIIIATVGERVD